MTIRVPRWILGFIWGQEVRCITKQSYAGCDPAHHWSIFVWAWVSPAGWASKLSGGVNLFRGDRLLPVRHQSLSLSLPPAQDSWPWFQCSDCRKGECKCLLGCLHSLSRISFSPIEEHGVDLLCPLWLWEQSEARAKVSVQVFPGFVMFWKGKLVFLVSVLFLLSY